MTELRQILAVAALGFSTLSQRRGTSLVIVAGVGCVVAVLVSMLSVTAGLTRMYLSGGNGDRVVVIRKALSANRSPSCHARTSPPSSTHPASRMARMAVRSRTPNFR